MNNALNAAMAWMAIARRMLCKNKKTNDEDYANNEKLILVKRQERKRENKNDYK